MIIEGNKKLAAAYATHVLDVYDHFSWRYTVKRLKSQAAADQSLSKTPEERQSKDFDAAGNIRVAQLKFWMSAAV